MGGPSVGGHGGHRACGVRSSAKVSSKALILKRLVGLSLLSSVSGLIGAGCMNDPVLTQPSQTGAIAVESFTGTLPKAGTVFYSFTVPRSGNASLTLLTLTVGGAPTDASITMGLGSPPRDCQLLAGRRPDADSPTVRRETRVV